MLKESDNMDFPVSYTGSGVEENYFTVRSCHYNGDGLEN